MSSVSKTRSRASRAVRGIVVTGMLVTVAACSSSANRFGPYDDKTWASNASPTSSAYPSAPGQRPAARMQASNQKYLQDPVHTAGINRDPISYRPVDQVQPVGAPRAISPVGQAAPYRPTGQVAKSVVVQPGDTVYSISRRHGVTVGDLAASNQISPPYTIKVGQRLALPGYGQPAPGYAAQGYQAPRQYTANVPQAQSAAGGSVHKVQPGQTIYALSRLYGVKPMTIAAHNGIAAPYHIQVGQQVRIPANGGAIAAAPVRKPVPDYRAASNKVVPAKAGPERKVSIKAAREPAPAAPRKVAQRKPYRGPLPTPEPRTSSKFRWPVKGKVISKFGRKSNGARNDGINISVPPGTTVRAAENGVVAYAGSELKGYGNLVLVRHSDNWVTAYAHNSDLLVQRGDRVKRGDVIARAGRTGSVSSPQVHFEIRRGAKAVDPMSHMTPTNVASN